MKVLVLGCGPAGLLAAHAARFGEDVGVQVAVVSMKQKSQLFGCQYLHGPIPGLDLTTDTVTYALEGTAEDYATKVYGSRLMAGTVSPATLTGSHPAWDIRQAYDQLWDYWEPHINDLELHPRLIQSVLDQMQPDVVITSVPLWVLCQDEGHAFRTQDCWALGDAPELGQQVPVPCPPSTILCNGTRDSGWYRVSNVFGYKTAEWPITRPKPPIPGVVRFSKPLATTCDCWPDFIRVGRYGTWTKGVLSHEAFNTAFATVQGKCVS